VRAINETTGWLTTLAGVGVQGTSGDDGLASAAELDLTEGNCGVAVDRGGNLLIDQSNRIRMVVASSGTWYGRYRIAGDIYTIAGGGTQALRDGERATHVGIGISIGLAVDSAGNVIVTDRSGNRLLLVAARSATLYGIRVLAVAGAALSKIINAV
jgi:hypothetical protein